MKFNSDFDKNDSGRNYITTERKVQRWTLQVRGMYRGQTLQVGGSYRGRTLQVRGMYRGRTLQVNIDFVYI